MKYLALFLLLATSWLSAFAQSVSISSDQNQSAFSQNTFPLYENSLIIGSNSVEIGEITIVNPSSWSSSYQGKKATFLINRGDIFLTNVDASGKKISETLLEFFDTGDQTLRVYSFDDGRSVVRDNVANFTFFDAAGELDYSISNSSQSADGERESQLSADPSGRTVVLYNPVIAFGNSTGSRANIVYGEGRAREFYRDPQREIQKLHVSTDGAFISILSKDGNRSRVLLFDRFGNELYQYDTDDDLEGITLSPGADYITKYSSGRVQVFQVQTGEIMGSASSRSSIVYATYIPQDEIVLALGGVLSGRNITNPSITAVHLTLRQIVREDIDLSLSAINTDDIRAIRTGEGSYRLTGLNRNLILETRF